MRERQFAQSRLYLTVVVLFLELAHLGWEYFNGGVRSHHLLNSADLPAISNWWGILLLPALAWLLIGRIQKRITVHSGGKEATSKLPMHIVAGVIGALLFGVLLSVSFSNNYETITEYLFEGLLVFALLLPVYRSEYILGFVLGMTFTFGVILPTLVACIIAALSAVIHLYMYPGIIRLWNWLKPAH